MRDIFENFSFAGAVFLSHLLLTLLLFAKRIVAERKDLVLSLMHIVSLFAYRQLGREVTRQRLFIILLRIY